MPQVGFNATNNMIMFFEKKINKKNALISLDLILEIHLH
jgi:hypothetical protein